MFLREYALNSLAETQALGQKIAQSLCVRDIVLLKGELGAGKTALARSIITALNPDISQVPSPTFTLVQMYETPQGIVWHFDLYRLQSTDEALELGLDEAFALGMSLIEWPERLGRLRLPSSLIEITLTASEETDSRKALIRLPESWDQKWKT